MKQDVVKAVKHEVARSKVRSLGRAEQVVSGNGLQGSACKVSSLRASRKFRL